MSETVKVGRNRPPQNGWASKEEVAELRAEVAELRETNQMMLEEIKGLRAELGGAKRRHFLGAVATSAAAFFGKFFHRGEDLGDFHEEKSSKGANRGAHAKGKEKEKEKEKEKGGTPIVPARRDEKSKISREREDKPNKNKTPGRGKKIVAGALALVLAAGSAVYAFSPHKNDQDLPKDPSITETNANKQEFDINELLRTSEVKQALAEQKAEADLQNKANEMGMSVESMKRLADEHGMPYDAIGTAEAKKYMIDNSINQDKLSEKSDFGSSEKAKEAVIFAVYNNDRITAEIHAALTEDGDSADAGLDGLENPDAVNRQYQAYEVDRGLFENHRKEVLDALNNGGTTYNVREATGGLRYTYYMDGDDIEVSEVRENNDGNERILEIVFPNRAHTRVQVKELCCQTQAGKERNYPRKTRLTSNKFGSKQIGGTSEQSTNKPPRRGDGKDPSVDPSLSSGASQTSSRGATSQSASYENVSESDAGDDGDTSTVSPTDGSGTAGGAEPVRPGDSSR